MYISKLLTKLLTSNGRCQLGRIEVEKLEKAYYSNGRGQKEMAGLEVYPESSIRQGWGYRRGVFRDLGIDGYVA